LEESQKNRDIKELFCYNNDMKKFLLPGAFLVLLILFGAWWYFTGSDALNDEDNLGSYAYECDEHVSFVIAPSVDAEKLYIKSLAGAYPPEATLVRQATNSGARFEGGGVVLVAHGENVVLGEGDSAIGCSPILTPDEAPFNFGD
jgi:hypothetical protein